MKLILSLCALLVACASAGELRLANIFQDGMVLQQNERVRIWGWGTPGQGFAVSFAGHHVGSEVGADGRWMVPLLPLEASAVGRKLRVFTTDEEIVLEDVLVGEVWVCGGQSNMEWTMRADRDADLELSAANFPQIRYIRIPKLARLEPQDDFPRDEANADEGSWRQAVPGSVDHCSAVGYYFARRLHRQLNVPIGIIDNSWGGTRAMHWCSKKTLAGIEEMDEENQTFEEALTAWNEGGGEEGAAKRYAEAVAAWEKERDAAKEAGEKEPRKPSERAFQNPAHQRVNPGGMFNGSLKPISGMTVKGVLFYQGENNSFGTAWKPFHRTFPAVIADWRKAFHKPELPFGIVQIAGWSTRRSMSYDMNHHCNVVREVQFDTWRSTPNTGLIVTFDANSNGSIHPGRKQPVGERSARWALSEVYKLKQAGSDKPLEWRGPVYESTAFEEGKARVLFEPGTDRGLRLDQDVDIGFVLAGADKVFHHARARVGQDNERRPHIQVWSDDVPEPVAVRYAHSNLPIGGLMNGRELPAYPFRSDNWAITPHQSTGSYVRQAKSVEDVKEPAAK